MHKTVSLRFVVLFGLWVCSTIRLQVRRALSDLDPNDEASMTAFHENWDRVSLNFHTHLRDRLEGFDVLFCSLPAVSGEDGRRQQPRVAVVMNPARAQATPQRCSYNSGAEGVATPWKWCGRYASGAEGGARSAPRRDGS